MKTFLALYTGSPGATRADLDPAAIAKGMAAWTSWMTEHASIIVDNGGPLGKTKKASRDGLSDTHNHVAGYVVVKAPSHDAAVKLFEGHPHFSIFPGEAVEVMEVMPIPGA